MSCRLLLVSVLSIIASLDLLQYPEMFATPPHKNSVSPVGRNSGENVHPRPYQAMSQLHGILPATQLPPAPTWAAGLGSRFSLTPTCAAFDWSSSIVEVIQPTPLTYGKLKLMVLPAGIPGP